MAAITRLQLMHSSSIIKPSAFLSKIPFSLNSKIHASRRRRFSKAPLLCSTSNPDPEVLSLTFWSYLRLCLSVCIVCICAILIRLLGITIDRVVHQRLNR